MKKLVAWIVSLCLMLCLVGCSSSQEWKQLLKEGEALLEDREPEEAAEVLKQALDKAPEEERSLIYQALIQAYLDMDEPDSARRYLEEARDRGFQSWRYERLWERLNVPEQTQPDPGEEGATAGQEEPSQLYTIERKDHSIYNDENKTTGAELYYELLQFNPELAQFASANQLLYADYEKYVNSLDFNVDDDILSHAETNGYILMYTFDTSVTYQDERLICVRQDSSWWMGGVFNGDYDARVFSMENGQLLTLADLLGNDSETLKAFRQFILDYLYSQGDYWFESGLDQIRSMELEEFQFYIDQDGSIVIFFDTYDLAPGAAGTITIPYSKTIQELMIP